MAKAQWCGEAIYDAAQAWLRRCLCSDDSLFSPGTPIWTRPRLELLVDRVGDTTSPGTGFIERFANQLASVPPEAVQLGAELLFTELLAEADTGGATKRSHVERILTALPAPLAVPAELDAAFDAGGTASMSAGKSFRAAFLRFLARLALAARELSPDARAELAVDPWALRRLVHATRTSTDTAMANALLHLTFPETFSYMISERHRRLLLRAFAAVDGADVLDGDEAIQAIERAIAPAGGDAGFYDQPLARVWKEGSTRRWDEAVQWAGLLLSQAGFDDVELDYKRALAERLAQARDELTRDAAGGLDAVAAALNDRRNNLITWRTRDRFVSWCRDSPRDAAVALRALWRDDESLDQRIGAFLAALPADVLGGTGTRLSLVSLLLGAGGAEQHPLYRAQVAGGLRRILGVGEDEPGGLDPEAIYRPEDLAAMIGVDGRRVRDFLREAYPRDAAARGADWHVVAEQAEHVLDELGPAGTPDSAAATYARWRLLLEELRLRLIAAGKRVDDLLVAQSLAWWLVQGEAPADWPPDRRAAFQAFRERPPAAAPVHDPAPVVSPADVEDPFPAATAALARRLSFPLDWLESLVSELRRKRQVILHGPPGTGKTYVALELGRHVEEHGGRCELVQFHPSYTYEDFFEGYRPHGEEGGSLSFKLERGVLRDLADDARAHPERPHLLVIDEINRGNIAKVFGELYFLLEYRSREIRLQYSREPFTLPENLFVIGTMNTMDRSIALFDSALRRRFSFFELDPTREPVEPVLAAWLARQGLDTLPALLLAELNAALAPEGLAFGHSYFIGAGGAAPDVEQIWAREIMPMLEDHFHGSGRAVEQEFGIHTMQKRAATAVDASDAELDDDRA